MKHNICLQNVSFVWSECSNSDQCDSVWAYPHWNPLLCESYMVTIKCYMNVLKVKRRSASSCHATWHVMDFLHRLWYPEASLIIKNIIILCYFCSARAKGYFFPACAQSLHMAINVTIFHVILMLKKYYFCYLGLDSWMHCKNFKW